MRRDDLFKNCGGCTFRDKRRLRRQQGRHAGGIPARGSMESGRRALSPGGASLVFERRGGKETGGENGG